MSSALRGKNILITSGPTWIPIDRVRVISNIATGQTGVLLAQAAKRHGAKVTLALGPVAGKHAIGSVRVINYRFFSELYELLKKELTNRRYHVVIHTAAVSDFKPKRFVAGKINSNAENPMIDLESTVKIVDKIKKFRKDVFLVAFKLEIAIASNELIKRAHALFKQSNADLVVANRFDKHSYRALIIDREKNVLGSATNKAELSKTLLTIIKGKI
ncbi:phosphopantothenoylcysteine decarboxylase [Candidatus Omnitrophota bacterium]